MSTLIDNVIQYSSELLQNNGIILLLLCYVIGEAIKRSPKFDKIPNDNIPVICAIIGGIIAALTPSLFAGEDISIKIFKGMILGFASTGIYETIRNYKNTKK